MTQQSYFQIRGSAGAGYSRPLVYSWRTGDWNITDGDDGSGSSFQTMEEAEQRLADAKAPSTIREVEIIEITFEKEDV